MEQGEVNAKQMHGESKAMQGKENHKSQGKQKQSKARQMQVKAKPWRWGRAKAKLAGSFKKG